MSHSKRLEKEVVEGLKEDVVPHHHHQCFWYFPEALVDQSDYIGKVSDKYQKDSRYLLLTNSDLARVEV
mgnify:CR=1 FL=1